MAKLDFCQITKLASAGTILFASSLVFNTRKFHFTLKRSFYSLLTN